MANRYPLVVNQTNGVIQELQSVDGLELGNCDVANVGNLNVTKVANLGIAGNVRILGGANGQVLKTDGTGNLTWGPDSAAAAGANNSVQFNVDGSFTGSSNFTFNSSNNSIQLAGTATVGNVETSGTMVAVGNVTGGNFICATGVLVIRTTIPAGPVANGTIAIDAANNRLGVYYDGSWKYSGTLL
jgi:hypothetical protein